jgi:hypothetical protein
MLFHKTQKNISGLHLHAKLAAGLMHLSDLFILERGKFVSKLIMPWSSITTTQPAVEM